MEKSQRKNLTTRLHPELKRKARIQAAQEGRHIADIIEDALVAYLSSAKVKAS